MITTAIPLSFVGMALCFIAGALCGLIFIKDQKHSHATCSLFAVFGCLLGIWGGLEGILTQKTVTASFPSTLPYFKAYIHIDSLASFFILIICTIGILCSIYGYRYMQHYQKTYNLGVFGFFYNLFIFSMILVVTSYNGLYFLFVWELMSLFASFLIVFEHKNTDTIRAGILYFVMTHIASSIIAIAFFILYQTTGSFDFDSISQQANLIPLLFKNIVFICMLIGFGTKAGIIPFHIWLPRAHSAAPSHISALMSGVIIKMGIFMIIRVFFDLLPEPALWWGMSVLIIGAGSSVLGVLYALAEHDIKRLLAYHSIENIGIILLGLGSGLVFKSLGLPTLASIALVGALFHTMNHAIFKSLLFLSAGSVIEKTHTRNIEEYGGLIKKMPVTTLCFLIGALAISGFPPLNGFASEWITYQSLLHGVLQQSMGIKSVFIIGISSLAATGGLAAACFVKVFGITFLARPRSVESQKASESSATMTSAMGILAILCVLLGLTSPLVVNQLKLIANSLGPNTYTQTTGVLQTNLQSSINLPGVFLGLIVALTFVYIAVYLVSRRQKVVTGITWSCGFNSMSPRGEITATGFARSLILIFRGIFQPSKQSTVEYVDANTHNPYVTKSKKVMLSTLNMYETYLYRPLDRALKHISEKTKIVQSGNINGYLLYIFITLISLLLWVGYV